MFCKALSLATGAAQGPLHGTRQVAIADHADNGKVQFAKLCVSKPLRCSLALGSIRPNPGCGPVCRWCRKGGVVTSP
jgi:hypothetical protein